MKKLVQIIILTFSASTCFADEQTDWGKVTEIWSGYKDGKVLFKLDIPHENPKSCGASTFYVAHPDHTDAAKFLSLLLTAKSTGSSVQLMLSTTECNFNYPVALRMGIK